MRENADQNNSEYEHFFTQYNVWLSKEFQKKKSLKHTQKIICFVLSGKIRDKGFLLILLFSSQKYYVRTMKNLSSVKSLLRVALGIIQLVRS